MDTRVFFEVRTGCLNSIQMSAEGIPEGPQAVTSTNTLRWTKPWTWRNRDDQQDETDAWYMTGGRYSTWMTGCHCSCGDTQSA
jgi:hypothetical protein